MKYISLLIIALWLPSFSNAQFINWLESFENIDSATKLPKGWTFQGAGICKVLPYHVIGKDTLRPKDGKNMILLQKNGQDTNSGIFTMQIIFPKGGYLESMGFGARNYKKRGLPPIGGETEFIRLQNIYTDIDGIQKVSKTHSIPFSHPDTIILIRGGYGPFNRNYMPTWFDTIQISLYSLLENDHDSGVFLLLDYIELSFDTAKIQLSSQQAIHRDQIKIFPNPSQGPINIIAEKSYTFDVYSPTGAKVYHGYHPGGQSQLEWPHSAGIYIIRFNNEKENLVLKVYIE